MNFAFDSRKFLVYGLDILQPIAGLALCHIFDQNLDLAVLAEVDQAT